MKVRRRTLCKYHYLRLGDDQLPHSKFFWEIPDYSLSDTKTHSMFWFLGLDIMSGYRGISLVI